MLKISKRAEKLTLSPLYTFFRKVKDAEDAGRKIISLGVGEPYNDTPVEIKEAGIEAIGKNITRYNPSAGSIKLREMLAKKYAVITSNVLVSAGAKPLLAVVFMALLDEGDVVIMAGPYYPPFFQIVESCGGKVFLIDTELDNFQLTLESVQAATRLCQHSQRKIHLLINSPNNPTGVVYEKKELEKIVRWCSAEDITIVADECYSNFSSQPEFTLRDFSTEIIVINSFSKTYAMTGWRVGYVVCPAEFGVAVARFLDVYLSCTSSISDYAAIAALEAKPLKDFVLQRELMHKWLVKMKIIYTKSTGGLFVFPDFSDFMKQKKFSGSIELAEYFLEKADVATTPGISFGEKYDTHLRLSYCLELEKLEAGLKKLEEVMQRD